jgi:hypothetical protein
MKSKYSTLIFLILLFFSCTQRQISNDKKISTPQVFGIVMDADTIKPPKIVPTGLPVVITIPVKDGGFYTKKKKDGSELKIDLKKAITILFDSLSPQGLPHFTNFNTEQGLALSQGFIFIRKVTTRTFPNSEILPKSKFSIKPTTYKVKQVEC